MQKRLLVPSLCVLVGCVVGATLPAVNAQSFAPPTRSTQRWEQFCEPNGARGSMNAALAQNAVMRGQEGFELVGLGLGWNTIMACYKRPISP